MSTFEDTIKRQILDENRRQWTLDDIVADDVAIQLARFEVEILAPLRAMEARGCFTLYEHPGSYRGSKSINLVKIQGEIAFDRL